MEKIIIIDVYFAIEHNVTVDFLQEELDTCTSKEFYKEFNIPENAVLDIRLEEEEDDTWTFANSEAGSERVVVELYKKDEDGDGSSISGFIITNEEYFS